MGSVGGPSYESEGFDSVSNKNYNYLSVAGSHGTHDTHDSSSFSISKEQDEEIARLVKETNAKTLKATDQMVIMMDESREAGYRANMQLKCQGEKLKGVEDDLDEQYSDLRRASADLDDMDGKPGCCGGRRRRSKGGRQSKKKKKKIKYNKVGEDEEADQAEKKGNFHYVTGDKEEHKMAENLELVDQMLDELDLLADDLNYEIKDQNKRTERIESKMKDNETKLQTNNEKQQKILEKAAGPKPANDGVMQQAMAL